MQGQEIGYVRVSTIEQNMFLTNALARILTD